MRAACDRYGVLLIADEVLTGAGRTGTWSALEPYGVVPDIMTLGKGIAGGYVPLSAVVAPRRIVDVLARGLGRAAPCADVLPSSDALRRRAWRPCAICAQHALIERCAAIAPAFHERLRRLRELPGVGDVRGRGLLAGIEFVADPGPGRRSRGPRGSRRPSPTAALDEGLVVWPNVGQADGVNGDLAMLAPPFIVTHDEIDLIVQRFGAALRATVERIGVVA